MANAPSFFLSILFLCNSVTSSDIILPHAKDFEAVWEKKQLFPSIRRTLIEYFRYKKTELDSIDPPTTASPSPPITNPVTVPPINSAPGIVTVPGTNPVSPTVTNPVSPPVTNPVSPPVTNPLNPPATNPVNPPATNPVNAPVTNPINPPVPVTNPVTTPSTTPAGSGGSGRWCVAKNGASQAALQSALDYACGTGGADCATIQQGSSCYEPATLQNHASYAFNSYYQKNPAPTSCDFGGAAAVTTANPSTGSCVYPSSSSTSSSPTSSSPTSSSPSPPATTQAPVNPTSVPTAPTTSSSGPGTQYPPPGSSLGNPDPTGLGAFGASPPLINTPSLSNNLQPFIGSLVTVASIMMFGL